VVLSVSILILMDVFLEGRHDHAPVWTVVVSILVLLDVFLEGYCRGVGHRRVMFQSLFSWMFFSKPWSCRPGFSPWCSFNPCSLGCFSRSLANPGRRDMPALGFNPCSLGCFSRSTMLQRGRPQMYRVSILVLLDVFLEVAISGVFGANFLFQSLFSWMFFSKSSRRLPTRQPIYCFNPCSLGCFSRRSSNARVSPRL